MERLAQRTLSRNGGQPLVAGQWQHVAATFSAATQDIRLFVNGVAVAGVVVPVGTNSIRDNVVRLILDTATPVRIGTFIMRMDKGRCLGRRR